MTTGDGVMIAVTMSQTLWKGMVSKMKWQRYNQDTWALRNEAGIYCVHLIKSKHYSYWLLQVKLANTDEVLDYGRYISAQKAIDKAEDLAIPPGPAVPLTKSLLHTL